MGFFLSVWERRSHEQKTMALEGDENLKIGLAESKTYQAAS